MRLYTSKGGDNPLGLKMNKELATLRKNHEPFEIETTRFLRQLTIQESLQAYAKLLTAFKWQLAQTAHLFQAERFETWEREQIDFCPST